MKKLITLFLFAISLLTVCPAGQAKNGKKIVPVQPMPSLTVSLTGVGAGTVTSSPPGIRCPGVCAYQFAAGTSITLTATPAPSNASPSNHGTGTEMYAWGGAACKGQAAPGTCSFTILADAAVSATFTPKDSDVWWISPAGSDDNDGRSRNTPFASIHKALKAMAPGDTLYFDDGVYADSLGGYNGTYTKDVVDGAAGKWTRFYAYNPLAATIDGNYEKRPLYLWHNNHVEVGYLRFLHSSEQPCAVDGSSSANADLNAGYIYVHDSGCAYSMPGGPGANHISLGINRCDHCVLERNWVWGYGSRYGIMLYAGTNNVARENVARYDGAPDGQPKAAVALYSEDNSVAENNIALDFDQGTDISADVHAAFFTTSSVTLPNYPYGLGTVAWYGNIAMATGQASNGGFYVDSHASTASGSAGTTPSTIIVRDNVIAGIDGSSATTAGMWFSADSAASANGGAHAVTIDHNTVYSTNTRAILRLDSSDWSSFAINNTILDGGRYTNAGCFNKAWSGTPGAANNLWFGCLGTLYTAFPGSTNADPAFRWLERVMAGPAFATASDGGNIGATVVNKYHDGTLSGEALWPFPNESYIRADLCAGPDSDTAEVCTSGAAPCAIYTRGHNASGFCASGRSLTQYIWRQLGDTSQY